MIPYDIIPEENQNWAIYSINHADCTNRIRVWRNKNNVIVAFIAFYESMWYSFWLSPDKDKDKYFYGTTVMFRKTTAVLRQVFKAHTRQPNRIFVPRKVKLFRNKNLSNPDSSPNSWKTLGLTQEEMVEVKIGRSTWLRSSIQVDKQLVLEGFIPAPWLPPACSSNNSYPAYDTGKARSSDTIKNEIEQQLSTSLNVPVWSDMIIDRKKPHPLTRCTAFGNSIWYCLDHSRIKTTQRDFVDIFNIAAVPFQFFENTVDWWTKHFLMSRLTNTDRSFLQKPAVRKLLQQAISETENRFALANSEDKQFWRTAFVAEPLNKFYYWLTWCNYIFDIWRDCPQDHLVNNFDLLQEVNLQKLSRSPNIPFLWLREEMPIASFFQVLRKSLEQAKAECGMHTGASIYDTHRGTTTWELIPLEDTLCALGDIINSGVFPQKPTRWRIQEWHDQTVAQSWKIKNKDFSLPQDMFPKPWHIAVENKDYCFIQPVSAHQLAQWGKAARNCIGSSHYSQRILNKQHFILMIMLDNKARFTAQVVLKDNVLVVSEIKDICNRQLTPEQKEEINGALQKALSERSLELS